MTLPVSSPTPEQAAIIEAPLAPSVVIAGAGSGKTETMAARVVWLVANSLVDPSRILGLTFTRKAASELQQRIADRLRPFISQDGAEEVPADPTVLTYAAYASRLVDEYAILLGREPGAQLLTEAARWQTADRVARSYDGSFTIDSGVLATVTERSLSLAAQLADHLVEPAAVVQYSRQLQTELELLPLKPTARSREWPENVQKLRDSLVKRLELLPLVDRFNLAKRSAGVTDFADQMVLATELAQLAPVAESERSRYDVVLLDEYQDTGFAQVAMLTGLFADGRPVTAVGDPLQSIYGWRGASSDNIHGFAGDFPRADGTPADRYGLTTSWRNDRAILRAANAIAAELRTPEEAPLAERDGAGTGTVTMAYTETVETEADWLATVLSGQWSARQDWTNGERTMAVLVRKRSGIALIAERLRDAGLPVEIVDLGGLLSLPEIADVRAVLQVLADHNAGGSLGRLLTGSKWRIGAADLVALHERARTLARMTSGALARHLELLTGAEAATADRDESDRLDPSLVEALDDLGEPEQYSAEGYARLRECGALLRRLRRQIELPIPDLIFEIETALGLDIEVAARSEARSDAVSDAGRANLDRFTDEAARFLSERSGAGLTAFLAYLSAAEEEEYGLKPAAIEVQADRVQILTVHGAKGLEWDVVAVAGLVDKGFPDAPRGHDWTTTPALLPSRLRGDRASLPSLDFDGCDHRGDAELRVAAHHSALAVRHRGEERRLAYVAFTRARKALYLSGAAWGTAATPREPSVFLTELAELVRGDSAEIEVAHWHTVDPDDTNPMTANRSGTRWPADPLSDRRPIVEHAARMVRGYLNDPDAIGRTPPATNRAAKWRRDVELLLAERAAAERRDQVEVAMPAHLSVSDVVALQEDEQSLGRRLRRPTPQRPAPQARRGTAFHSWLEQRWKAETLLDIDELPGAVDELADDDELDRLKAAFEASRWADAQPFAIEVPFEMTFGGRVIRGRMDAVFRDSAGRFTVVDWKTGTPPSGKAAAAKAVQLALYRLAWANLQGIGDDELGQVTAAFYYVGAGVEVAPADLLTAEQIRELIEGS
jgi:ATP-dependent DNA helicase UvrD/PcrA